MIAYRQLRSDDIDSAAAVHRASLDEQLPWLAGRHTADDDRGYFRDHVFKVCEVWGAFEEGKMIGVVAFREGWIDQLHVMPGAQGRGVGSALLREAQARFPRLSLWTFQRNERARRFYEARGFVALEETDGSRCEEKEPDVRYFWSRS
jgi:ribosomal protein S18 acetylase RimI-like enzyme